MNIDTICQSMMIEQESLMKAYVDGMIMKSNKS